LRHHRKTPAGIAGACGFDGRVQRQQVGLLGDRMPPFSLSSSSPVILPGCAFKAMERASKMLTLAWFANSWPVYAIAGTVARMVMAAPLAIKTFILFNIVVVPR